jgi:hypothetical protein
MRGGDRKKCVKKDDTDKEQPSTRKRRNGAQAVCLGCDVKTPKCEIKGNNEGSIWPETGHDKIKKIWGSCCHRELLLK